MSKEETETTTVDEKEDPTKVSRSAQITKKERTPAQKANDRNLGKLSVERKEKKLAEKRGAVISPQTKEITSSSTMVLLGVGGVPIVGIAVAVWFLFLREKSKKEEEKKVEEEEDKGYISE